MFVVACGGVGLVVAIAAMVAAVRLERWGEPRAASGLWLDDPERSLLLLVKIRAPPELRWPVRADAVLYGGVGLGAVSAIVPWLLLAGVANGIGSSGCCSCRPVRDGAIIATVGGVLAGSRAICVALLAGAAR